MNLTEMGKRAKACATALSVMHTEQKNRALLQIAQDLLAHCNEIIAANQKDIQAAQENGMSAAMQDRLRLDESRIRAISAAVRAVADLPDPAGRVLGGGRRPNGLEITRISVPLGVVGIIFESRPNVTVDCAVLCLKSGNACILRGGKEAIHSNRALTELMRQSLIAVGVVPDAIQLVQDTSRESATQLMRLNAYLDLLIPRGGAGLIQTVVQNATVPVIETGAGNCHIYVDSPADLTQAVEILDNAKTSRPSVCNAVETLLVHKDIAAEFLPAAAARLAASHVELRGCPQTLSILGAQAIPADDQDWATEYDDYILAIRVVDDMQQAVEHIARHSTHHSETIVTRDFANARQFCSLVDSAAVYVNASTRFTDGGEFGLGAEIGISTQKLHARGPMGLEHLTSSKYVIYGTGQTR
jgi:gamma-glutamyl phosphate reductase